MTSGQPRRDLRVGDAEREAAIEKLGEHLSNGYIDLDEYNERSGNATTARTGEDLDQLFADLPGPHQRSARQSSPTPGPSPGNAPPPPETAHRPSLYPHPATNAPHGLDVYGRPLSSRNRWAAAVLQLVFPFGAGRFYAGSIGMAIAQLLLSFIGIGVAWCMIDGIILLAAGGTDSHGRRLWS